MPEIAFADLRELLERLGFTATLVPGSHVLFQHHDACKRFLLRVYADADIVEPALLQTMRFQLDAWGLMADDEFDEQIRQLSLAG